MKYFVTWLLDAEKSLKAISKNSAVPGAVFAAATELDQRLSTNPNDEGESRPNGRRITFAPPLAIIFRVYEEQSTVVVTHLWEFR